MIANSSRLETNNFDLLRLLFAAMVCLVHAHQLSNFPQLAWISTYLSSALAIKSFFVVSGFLVFMSFERSASLRSYALKRVRRIYPAYATVVVGCALLLVLVSTQSPGDYYSADFARYLLANLAFLNFLQPTLPGVFESNHYGAVNGALWTIKIEVMFYLSVPVLALLFRVFSHKWVLAAAYCSSVAYGWGLSEWAQQSQNPLYVVLARQFPGQLCYFVAGAGLYYFLPLFERYCGYLVATAAPLLIVDQWLPLPLLEPLALAIVVIFLALFFYIGNFGKYGDFSYGIYILHFPIIQLLLLHSPWQYHPVYFLLAVVTLVVAAAVCLWHLVERPFLIRSSHYIRAASGSTAGIDTAKP